MLDSYLETNIQNKLKLLVILNSSSTVSIKELKHTLHLSSAGINSLIDELNLIFQYRAKIEKKSSYFFFVIYENVNFFHLLHSIYKSSSVLHCLKFMILNDNEKPFSEFIKNEYLTKSSAYRIRQNCHDYLSNIGLDIKKNRVIGEEYRIRFLIALLHYKYGIDCYYIDDNSLKIARDFILSTNQVIDMNYLEQTSHEYGYFECLFILSWKRKDYHISFFQSEQLENLKRLFIYEKTKKVLKTTVELKLHIDFSENDYDYIYLIYCCTNSCLFADKWTQEDIDKVHNIIFSDVAFSDLLQRFENKFGREIQSSHPLRATLIYFYKKCLLELQCIIPDKTFYMYSKKSHLTTTIAKDITEILNSWQKANGRKYKIYDDHLFYLALQIEFILRQYIKPIQVFILSDLNAELEVMHLYLTRSFSSRRIKITSLLFNAQNKDFLYSQKKSVIIVHKKFGHVINFLGLAKQNIVVPVTSDINEREINAIQNAITKYEEEVFLNFIKHE